VRCRKAGGSRALADIVLLDQSDARLVELREVELVALPDQRRTFERRETRGEPQVEN
jgi:hypothetical protein